MRNTVKLHKVRNTKSSIGFKLHLYMLSQYAKKKKDTSYMNSTRAEKYGKITL
jgi:hypothetical protein